MQQSSAASRTDHRRGIKVCQRMQSAGSVAEKLGECAAAAADDDMPERRIQGGTDKHLYALGYHRLDEHGCEFRSKAIVEVVKCRADRALICQGQRDALPFGLM